MCAYGFGKSVCERVYVTVSESERVGLLGVTVLVLVWWCSCADCLLFRGLVAQSRVSVTD